MPWCPHISEFNILDITWEMNRGLSIKKGTSVQMMQKIRRSSWHHSGFCAIWPGARRVSHPSSPPRSVSVSVTHTIRENILAFLATDQYDLYGQAPTALLLGTQLASVFSFPSVPHSPCWGRLWVIITSVHVSNWFLKGS